MVPKEYYDPTILKEDVYVPCLAGQTLPLCAHYTYPDLFGNPQVMSTDAQIPGRGDEPYGVEGRDDLLSELQTRKLTPVANYQPNVSLHGLVMIIMVFIFLRVLIINIRSSHTKCIVF